MGEWSQLSGQRFISYLWEPQFIPPQGGHPAHIARITAWFVEAMYVSRGSLGKAAAVAVLG